MNYILFDDKTRISLLPLTFTKPISELRVGILTIKEKWDKILNSTLSYYTEAFLNKKYTTNIEEDNILINASILPDKLLLKSINLLKSGEALTKDDYIVALRTDKNGVLSLNVNSSKNYTIKEYNASLIKISNTYDIFSKNDTAILDDFHLITKEKKSEQLSSSVNKIGDNPIFIEEGGKAEFCTINTTDGPVYIGKDAEIMEGALVRGPLAMCEHSVIKMGAKVYGATTLGPHCKCGGELNNVMFMGFSNKAHDGFLGNAVIGEWCNIGADTNNSNLKNTYDSVKLWNYETERFNKTGLQFCGLIMGDHSKLGINSMINTGTVIGVGCNIFGADFPRNFIPSFSWGGSHGYKEHNIDRFFKTATIVMDRRNIELNLIERDIILHVFDITGKYRKSY